MMKYKLIIFFLGLCLFIQAQNCESERYQKAVFNTGIVTENIIYGSADVYDPLNIPFEFNLTMDVYEPYGDTREKRPVVFMSFGGAYIIGDKNHADIEAWCDSLARYGYVAVALNYRLGLNAISQGSAIRAMYRGVQDTRAAIRYLLEFQEDYKIDPNHIYVGGESAGAINSLHTAFMEESDRPQETFGIPLEPFDLGCLDCSGNNYQHNFEIKGIIDLWGAILDINYIEPSEQIPTLIIHGTDDVIVPVDEGYPFVNDFQLTFPYLYSSESIQQKMNDLGIYNEYYPYQGQGHLFYGLPDGVITFPNEFWNPVWTQGHEFLFRTLQFETPKPQGEIQPAIGQNYTYSINENPGSIYCWEIVGGNIVADNNSNIVVQWNGGMGEIRVTEENCIGVIGNISETLEIDAVSSLEENEMLPGLKIIPTLLFQGENIFLTSEKNKINSISIMDIRGRNIFSKQINQHYFELSTQKFNSGLFLLKIEIEGKIFFQKIVIK